MLLFLFVCLFCFITVLLYAPRKSNAVCGGVKSLQIDLVGIDPLPHFTHYRNTRKHEEGLGS